MSGVADIAPYTLNGTRLALTPIRFGPGPADRPRSAPSRSSTGRSRTGGCRHCAYRSPAGSAAAELRLRDILRGRQLQLSPDRLAPARRDAASDLPDRRGDDRQAAGGAGARQRALHGPVLNGRLGSSPLHLAAAGGQIVGKHFSLNNARHAARQAGLADRLRRLASDRHFRRRRHYAANSAGPRRRSATSRCCSATARAAGCSARQSHRRQRADRLRPRRQPALLSAARATTCISRLPATMSVRPARCAIRRAATSSPTSRSSIICRPAPAMPTSTCRA